MQRNRRFLIAALFLGLILPGISFSSFGASGPALSPGVKDAASQSALTITMYLTDALRLSQGQAIAVRQCTQAELEQLVSISADSAPDAALQVQKQYETTMGSILTPKQYQHFQQLERSAPVGSSLARVLAVR